MNNVYFIIPVYNESGVVRDVVDKVLKKYKNVVCVDDGSTDNSLEELEKTEAYVVKHPINMGQGAALQTGIEFARTRTNAEYFVTFDADGQHRLEDVQTMLEMIQKGNFDIILGSRFLGSSAVDMPRMKTFILKAAIRFSNITSGVKLTDTHNGLRVFNRAVADAVDITMSDMAHASELLEMIHENDFRYKEIPVQIVYSDYSKGKGQSALNAVNIAFDVLLRRISK